MKKFILIILSITVVFNANNVNAQEHEPEEHILSPVMEIFGIEQEEGYPLMRLSPYLGTICGFDISYLLSPNVGLYLGAGRNFMTSTEKSNPVGYEVGGIPTYLAHPLESKLKEYFRISFGYAANNWTLGAHVAIVKIQVNWGPYYLDKNSGGAGIEVSYSFLGNLFIKASATYFGGEKYFSDNPFGGGDIRFIFNDGTDNRIGSSWIFGASIGYHFYLFGND